MINKIINCLDKITIDDIYFQSYAEQICHKQKVGAYLFEIHLSYDKEVLNFVGASYLEPEEGDLKYTIKRIDMVYVYDMHNKLLELTDEDYKNINDVLDFNLVGERKTQY